MYVLTERSDYLYIVLPQRALTNLIICNIMSYCIVPIFIRKNNNYSNYLLDYLERYSSY